jgi:phytoene/squalene synthetase
MAQFTIEILPDEKIDQVFEGYAYFRRYDSRKLEGETKQEFTRRDILERLRADADEGLKKKKLDEAAAATTGLSESIIIQ